MRPRHRALTVVLSLVAATVVLWLVWLGVEARGGSTLPPARSLVAAGDGTCALSDDGVIRCWGHTGQHASRRTAVVGPSHDPDAELVSRDGLGCVVRPRDGTVCWRLGREHDYGEAALAADLRARTVPRLRGIGGAIGGVGCGIDPSNRLFCWGDVIPRGPGAYPAMQRPWRVHAGPVERVGISANTICVIDGSQEVACRLGRGARDTTFVAFEGREGAVELAIGDGYECIRTSSGEVRCHGTPFGPHDELRFASRPSLAGAIQLISASSSLHRHVCMVDEAGGARCDDGANVHAIDLRDVAALAVGVGAKYALTRDGDVRRIEAAFGDTLATTGPAVAISVLHGARQIGVGPSENADETVCTLSRSGAVHCLSSTPRAQNDEAAFATIAMSGPARWFARGAFRTCAADAHGRVSCWEDGPGDVRPTRAPELDGTSHGALGRSHACAIRERRVLCIGTNELFQADAGAALASIHDAVAIAAGANHTCILRASGRVSCWGDDIDGQSSGSGESHRRAALVEIAGLENVHAIAAGTHHSCARAANGDVWCWGRNHEGQAAPDDPSTRVRHRRVPLPGPASVVASGGTSSCAVVNGGVHCWGTLASSRTRGTTARPVARLRDAVSVVVGRAHGCAIDVRGAIHCWGAVEAGQLGPNPPTVLDDNNSVVHGGPSRTPVSSPMAAHRLPMSGVR